MNVNNLESNSYSENENFEDDQVNGNNLSFGKYQINGANQNFRNKSDTAGFDYNLKPRNQEMDSSRIVNNQFYGQNEYLKNDEHTEREYSQNSEDPQNSVIRQKKEDFYFQTKLRNSGFWGKVC